MDYSLFYRFRFQKARFLNFNKFGVNMKPFRTLTRKIEDFIDVIEDKKLECKNDNSYDKRYIVSRKFINFEDIIIDNMLTCNGVITKRRVKNIYIRSPFKTIPHFIISGGCLSITFQNNYYKIKEYIQNDNKVTFFCAFENFMILTLLNRGDYFTDLNKFYFKGELSLLHGVAIFLVFISKYFKRKIISFCFEFLLLFLYHLFRDCGSVEEVKIYIISIFILRKDYSLVKNAGSTYKKIVCNEAKFPIKSKFLIQQLIDYLIGIEILNL